MTQAAAKRGRAVRAARYASHVAMLSRLAFKRWTRRILFLIGGLCVGGAAVLMAQLADQAQLRFAQFLTFWPYIPLVLTPLGFGLAALLARTVFPNSQGSGIPQAIAALRIEDQAARAPLVSLRVAMGKIVVMALGLVCGASAGREGPTVQVGAAIMFAIGRFAPYRQAGFVLAGAAAGVAAAFNTPLAGIVFGIEEMSRCRASICAWSPGLDENGNSLLGRIALEKLARRMSWSVFAPQVAAPQKS